MNKKELKLDELEAALNFENAMRKIANAPKEEVMKSIAAEKKKKKEKDKPKE